MGDRNRTRRAVRKLANAAKHQWRSADQVTRALARERHAIARAMERVGVELTPGDLAAMAEVIRNGAERTGPNTYRVPYKGSVYEVAYSKKQDVIMTVLGATPEPEATPT